MVWHVIIVVNNHSYFFVLFFHERLFSVVFQNAVSMYCRLGFAIKKGQVISPDQLHPSWKSAPSVNRLKYENTHLTLMNSLLKLLRNLWEISKTVENSNSGKRAALIYWVLYSWSEWTLTWCFWRAVQIGWAIIVNFLINSFKWVKIKVEWIEYWFLKCLESFLKYIQLWKKRPPENLLKTFSGFTI